MRSHFFLRSGFQRSFKPDIARIYPVLVIEGTELAKMYQLGKYRPLELSRVVDLSLKAMAILEKRGIKPHSPGASPRPCVGKGSCGRTLSSGPKGASRKQNLALGYHCVFWRIAPTIQSWISMPPGGLPPILSAIKKVTKKNSPPSAVALIFISMIRIACVLLPAPEILHSPAPGSGNISRLFNRYGIISRMKSRTCSALVLPSESICRLKDFIFANLLKRVSLFF